MASSRFMEWNLVVHESIFIRQFRKMCKGKASFGKAEFTIMRRFAVLVIIAFMAISQTAVAQNYDISAAMVKPLELEQIQSKVRIVALANGSAEVISALGLRKSIVGRDIASTTPELKSIPIVTSGHQVLAEKVISLKPNLVIIDSAVGPKSAIDALRSAKIRVESIDEAWNVTDVYRKVTQVGVLIGEKEQAVQLVSSMKRVIEVGNKSIGWTPRVVFLYLRGPSSIYLIGGKGSGADSLIDALGGIDVGALTQKNPFNTLTSEALVAARPDIILVMTKGLKSVGGIAGLRKLPGIMQTNAGKSSKILSVDDSLLLSFGPRTPMLLTKMAEALRKLK